MKKKFLYMMWDAFLVTVLLKWSIFGIVYVLDVLNVYMYGGVSVRTLEFTFEIYTFVLILATAYFVKKEQ